MNGTSKQLLCLITGPSGSGKTSIALGLEKFITDACTTTHDHSPNIFGSGGTKRTAVILLHQDHYFIKPFLPYKKRKDDSYENNSGIDWDRLMSDIRYHTSKHPASIIIVEGHLLGDASAMFFGNFAGCCNILAVMITCSMESCKYRRLQRRPRSDNERNELATYIDNFVFPSFLKYGTDAMQAIRDLAVSKGWVLMEVDSDHETMNTTVDEILKQINELYIFGGK